MTILHRNLSTSTSIDTLAEDFLATVFEAERRYVASGWFDPVGLHDAAHRHGLCGNRFADRRLGFLYAYLAACVDRGVEPSIDQCLVVAERHGDVPLDRLDYGWLDRLIFATDFDAERIDEYAREVTQLADVRDNAARYHLREFTRLCVDESQFRITVQPVGDVCLAPTKYAREKRNGRRRQHVTV